MPLSEFWDIPLVPYSTPVAGIIKKQMRFMSTSQAQLDEVLSHVPTDQYVEQMVIKHRESTYMHSFLDERKISIGLCHKDIVHIRKKKKKALYNCIVLMARIVPEGQTDFREFHVIVFNTGVLELPGMLDQSIYRQLLTSLQTWLHVEFDETRHDTILINSQFTLGYHVDRFTLYTRLREKHNLNCIYDSCTYPGVRCKYVYDKKHNMTFIVFRTGIVLIVGKCNETVLQCAFQEIYTLLSTEQPHIAVPWYEPLVSTKPKKQRRKCIRY